MQSKYTKASDTLIEGQMQFIQIGNALCAAQSYLQSMGHILFMQCKYTEASDTLTEAQKKFSDLGNILGVVQCSQSLDNVFFEQNKHIKVKSSGRGSISISQKV
jgi:hypothetical protein